MEKLPEIADSLAVGQNYQEDQRVILFVKPAAGSRLTEELKDKIRRTLRENASPRHVPALILEAPDIPYTLNMKKVESAVTNILNGRAVSNKDALINPDSLEYYQQLVSQLQQKEKGK
jgi:acetoacetyl-CoA synthetase